MINKLNPGGPSPITPQGGGATSPGVQQKSPSGPGSSAPLGHSSGLMARSRDAVSSAAGSVNQLRAYLPARPSVPSGATALKVLNGAVASLPTLKSLASALPSLPAALGGASAPKPAPQDPAQAREAFMATPQFKHAFGELLSRNTAKIKSQAEGDSTLNPEQKQKQVSQQTFDLMKGVMGEFDLSKTQNAEAPPHMVSELLKHCSANIKDPAIAEQAADHLLNEVNKISDGDTKKATLEKLGGTSGLNSAVMAEINKIADPKVRQAVLAELQQTMGLPEPHGAAAEKATPASAGGSTAGNAKARHDLTAAFSKPAAQKPSQSL